MNCSLLDMSSSVYSLRYKDFLGRLKAARLEAGLTQSEVATLLNVPQSYISKCESGERRVDVIELMDFAAVYQKALLYFIDESNGHPLSVSTERHPL